MCTIEAVDFHQIKNRKIAFDNSLDFFFIEKDSVMRFSTIIFLLKRFDLSPL